MAPYDDRFTKDVEVTMLLGAGLVRSKGQIIVVQFDYTAEKFSVLICFYVSVDPRQDTWMRTPFHQEMRIVLHRMREVCNVSCRETHKSQHRLFLAANLAIGFGIRQKN
jgi:hypothetical protein